MQVLSEVEIARLWSAHGELEREPSAEERPWWQLARRATRPALERRAHAPRRRPGARGIRRRPLHDAEGSLLAAPDRAWAASARAPRSALGRRRLSATSATSSSATRRRERRSMRASSPASTSVPPFPGPGSRSRSRPFHDLRHTALTHEAAAGNPMAYVQLKAGHSQSAITERYIHAAQVLFPGAAARGEARVFSGCSGQPASQTDDAGRAS